MDKKKVFTRNKPYKYEKKVEKNYSSIIILYYIMLY